MEKDKRKALRNKHIFNLAFAIYSRYSENLPIERIYHTDKFGKRPLLWAELMWYGYGKYLGT